MGKISRIQLRGISRSPSDRMTEDGGVAESLNVQLDAGECAPSLVPEDVVAKLGLPDNLNAEMIYLHKTASYENYIIIKENSVGAIMPAINNVIVTILKLGENENVTDINSLGNTLIVSTQNSSYYILYRNSSYIFLGSQIPFPEIDVKADIQYEVGSYRDPFYREWWCRSNQPLGESAVGNRENLLLDMKSFAFTKEKWNEINKNENEASKEGWNRFNEVVLEQFSYMRSIADENQIFLNQIFVRYGIELYDGSIIFSPPYLLPGGFENSLGINYEKTHEQTKKNADASVVQELVAEYTRIYAMAPYKVRLKMREFEEDLTQWKDIITSVNIYMSHEMEFSPNKLSHVESYAGGVAPTYSEHENDADPGQILFMTTTRKSSCNLNLYYGNTEYQTGYESRLLNKSSFFLVERVELFSKKDKGRRDELKAGTYMKTEVYFADKEAFIANGPVTTDEPAEEIFFNKALQYNNTLIAYSIQSKLQSKGLLPVPKVTISQVDDKVEIKQPKGYEKTARLCMLFHVDSIGKEQIVAWRDFDNNVEVTDATASFYQFILFPSANCTQVDIFAIGEDIKKVSLPMQTHPSLPGLSYYYNDISSNILNLVTEPATKEELDDLLGQDSSMTDINNKLYISAPNSPFIFPLESRYTFQSKILGVAVASTTLSQGQYGQFPLYVFTEEGIWAMEAASDGSFITQKPMSRHVCINPDSITPLDNAVVFVTAQGVMMLQGSQVVNISPNMNGRHYQIENSARTIIENQDFFCDLLPALSDNTHFLAFVKEATVAYDYAGRRLIFIKKDEKYQYIYKLDTQTWHKGAYEVDLVAPINSYPECLVQGKKDGKTRIYDLSTILDAAESKTPVRGVIATRPFDLGEPDVFKTITDVRIRGQFPKGAVKFILLGSNDGINFATVSTLRGRAWKLFRMVILADLAPTERISWVDIVYDTKFTNKLR